MNIEQSLPGRIVDLGNRLVPVVAGGIDQPAHRPVQRLHLGGEAVYGVAVGDIGTDVVQRVANVGPVCRSIRFGRIEIGHRDSPPVAQQTPPNRQPDPAGPADDDGNWHIRFCMSHRGILDARAIADDPHFLAHTGECQTPPLFVYFATSRPPRLRILAARSVRSFTAA